MTIPQIIKAANMAKDLRSPDCINWEHLETMYAMKGRDHLLAILDKEKNGANNVYMCHLLLAETAILELPN